MNGDLGIVGRRWLIGAHGQIRRAGDGIERARWSVLIGEKATDLERAMRPDPSGVPAELWLSGDAADHRLENRLIQQQDIPDLQAGNLRDLEVG